MSRFGIRKRLKSRFGGGKSAPPPEKSEPTYEVEFECPDGSMYSIMAEEADSLVLASGRGLSPISPGCTDGTCGTCRVDVVSGADQLSPMRDHEKKTKADAGVPEHQRLGCHAGVFGSGIRVRITNVLGEELTDP
jgi:ferredoxin